MAPTLSKLESKVSLLLRANTSTEKITTTLKKSKRYIENTLERIRKKEINNYSLKRVSLGRISKTSSREKRVINRNLTRSPKKENRRVLLENNIDLSTRGL
jgi:hypothetical protein